MKHTIIYRRVWRKSDHEDFLKWLSESEYEDNKIRYSYLKDLSFDEVYDIKKGDYDYDGEAYTESDINSMYEMLSDVCELTSKPEINGRQIVMVLSPKNTK